MDMTEQFKNHNSFVHWFLIAALTGTEITDEVRAEPRIVTMQLNGAEINPAKAMLRLEEEFNRLVEKKATEMVDDIKQSVLDPFEQQIEEVSNALKAVMDEKINAG